MLIYIHGRIIWKHAEQRPKSLGIARIIIYIVAISIGTRVLKHCCYILPPYYINAYIIIYKIYLYTLYSDRNTLYICVHHWPMFNQQVDGRGPATPSAMFVHANARPGPRIDLSRSLYPSLRIRIYMAWYPSSYNINKTHNEIYVLAFIIYTGWSPHFYSPIMWQLLKIRILELLNIILLKTMFSKFLRFYFY